MINVIQSEKEWKIREQIVLYTGTSVSWGKQSTVSLDWRQDSTVIWASPGVPHIHTWLLQRQGRSTGTRKRSAFLLLSHCTFPPAPFTGKANIAAANKGELLQGQFQSHKAKQGMLNLGLRNNKLITGTLTFLSNRRQKFALLVFVFLFFFILGP